MTLDEIRSEVDEAIWMNHNYIERDGFIFTGINPPFKVYDALVIRNPSSARCWGDNIPQSTRSLEEHVALVNQIGVDSVDAVAEDFSFLQECPSAVHFDLAPSTDCSDHFDYSFLHDLKEIKSLHCATYNGKIVDYSGLRIENLYIFGNEYLGMNQVEGLKTLIIRHNDATKIEQMFGNPELDSLRIDVTKIKSLDGIEASNQLQCLQLNYNRSLRDISALKNVASTLKHLHIEKCAGIKDYSVLKYLTNLEYLRLEGNNSIPDLSFIPYMTNLKVFDLRMRVEDGDLSMCLSLPHMRLNKMCRHYNIEEWEIPKDYHYYTTGNENIPEWRRLYA